MGVASPRPNVAISGDHAPAELEIDGAVPDNFATEKTAVAPVQVSGWHTTLRNGFVSAFDGATSSYKLRIVTAELGFAPAAISTQGGVHAVRAQIRFKVKLIGADGTELGVIAGTVEAREANSSGSEEAMTTNTALAVEAMYEAISAKIVETAESS